MININRVFAMVLRYFLYLKHNLDRLSDMFYWPAMDIFMWGLTGIYIASLGNNSREAMSVILTGVVFWIVIWRAQYEITVNIMSEIWDRNLVNVLASPLTLPEWILSFLVVGIIKMVLSFTFAAILTFLLYQYNIFIFGIYLIPSILSLLLTGWTAGFLVSGFIIRFGSKIQTLSWTGVALILPFSAPFFPVATLPNWAQTVAYFVPASYVFETLREIINTGSASFEKLTLSLSLNIVYLILSIGFFVMMYNLSKRIGFGRLTG